MRDRQFYPYTRNEALKIVKTNLGLNTDEANKYLDNILDFADKYVISYKDWCAYPGAHIAEIERGTFE